MENQFCSLEDQVHVVMAAEGHGTAHSLEKQLHYQQAKESQTMLEKGKKSC